MFDPLAAAMHAVATRSVEAPVLIMLTGLLSSVGPCVAPRFVAVAGLAAKRSRRDALALALAFIGGIAIAFMSFGVAASLLGRMMSISHVIYGGLTVALFVVGLLALWREPMCSHRSGRERTTSLGGALLLGAFSAFVVSPCCTPVLVAILAYTSAVGDPVYGALLLGAFSIGHAAPLLIAGFGISAAGSTIRRSGVAQAAGVVGATLTMALAGYYAVLA
jgi:cytochrome c biogenesis protein CcdA